MLQMSAEGPAFVFRLNDNGLGPDLVRHVFLERGWLEFDEDLHGDNDWNFWWKTSRFRNCDYETLQPHQRLNHYPRSTAITKKDSLARNMKRMRGVYGPGVYNFSPVAFNLPNDYTRFVAEYSKLKEKGEKPFWICKPADLSRGRGIFVFQDLSELQYDCNAVVQRYICNPLLIAGYKFDLRIYVAVPSFHPLKAYVYREGLARFSTEKFDLTTLDNLFAHLTNTSINKHSPSYSVDKERVGPGCKWTFAQLRHYFHQANIDDSLMWTRIIQIVVLTLLIQAHQAPKATNCYELYGFDIIIDEQMKPWLLEVNFSPALSSDCLNDSLVKKPMLYDLVDLLGFKDSDMIPGFYESYQSNSQPLVYYPPSKACSHPGLLPRISSQSMHSLTMGAAVEVAEDRDEALTEEADEEQVVVPLIPGCGLPSVQTSQRYTASRRSSASSARSYGSYDSTEYSHRSSHGSQLQSNSSKSHNVHGYLRHKTLNKVSQPPMRAGLQPPSTLQSKLSVQSDSGVSMMSGSSDNSDPSSCNEDLAVSDGYGSTAKPKSTASNTQNDIFSNIKAMAPLKRSGKLVNGSAVTEEGTSDEKTLVTNAPTMSHYRSQATSREQRRSAQSSFTANSLVGKSVMLGRRSSIPNVSAHSGIGQSEHSSHRLSYARPWRTKGPGSAMTKPSISHREQPQFLPKAGDFMLVFPFNATLRKCAQGNLDDRIVIRECQRLVKQATPAKTGSKVSLDSIDSNPVADIQLPWGSFTKTEEIYSTH